MGFHLCEYCLAEGREIHYKLGNSSSGDVYLRFASGRTWHMPDMIWHYVEVHKWLPPIEFVEDVMNGEFVGGSRLQTKGIEPIQSIAFLSGEFETGEVPEGFVEKLRDLMERADRMGDRVQYRGL